MPEQQLVDYIKKAKQAGQSDDQSRALLLKNGWTEAEVNDAFVAINQPQQQTQPKPQPQTQPQQPKIQPHVQAQQQPQYQSKPQPQYQPQSSGIAMQSNVPAERKRSHLVLKLFIVLIILVVLGGVGYFAAGQYLNFSYSNLFSPNSQTVISKMMTNMAGVKSYKTTIQGSISAADSQNVGQGKVLFSADGQSDITDAANPIGSGTFTVQITSPGSASSMSANMSITSVNNKFYIKINDIALPDGVSYPGLDISQIKGRFFEIDQNSISQLSQSEGVGVGAPQINSQELVKKIQDLLLAENMFTVSKQLSDEVVSEQNTYHYLVNISKDKLKDLINKIIALTSQSSGTDSSGFLAASMTQSYINSFVDTVGDISAEIWVGKTDYLLYRFKIDKTIDLNKVSQDANMILTAKIDVINSNFGEPVLVQAPETSQKIEDIILPLLKIQPVASDMSQISGIAQSAFDAEKSFASLCNHNLLNGYLDNHGSSLVSLNNDILSQGAKKPVCLADETDFCVSTQLPDGSFMCIDKNGSGKIKCVSAQTACSPGEILLKQ